MSIEAVFCDGYSSHVPQIQTLRKRIFVDRCGWQLHVVDEREVDEFDLPETVHLALRSDGGLIGTFRANRTDRRYLAREIFPGLAITGTYPTRPDAWEISRFGVLDPRNINVAKITYALMFYFASRMSATSLVAIADLTYERFLRTQGIRTRRYGPPGRIGDDRHGRPLHAIAGEIPLALQNPARLAAFAALLQTVEIADASHVFGPARVSA